MEETALEHSSKGGTAGSSWSNIVEHRQRNMEVGRLEGEVPCNMLTNNQDSDKCI